LQYLQKFNVQKAIRYIWLGNNGRNKVGQLNEQPDKKKNDNIQRIIAGEKTNHGDN
jgi:hypothetical protein